MLTVRIATVAGRWAGPQVTDEAQLSSVDDIDDAVIAAVTERKGFATATIHDERGAQLGRLYPVLGFMPDTGG